MDTMFSGSDLTLKTTLKVACPVTGVEVEFLLSFYRKGVTTTTQWCEQCGNTHLFTVSLIAELIGTQSSRTDDLVWKAGEYQKYVVKFLEKLE